MADVEIVIKLSEKNCEYIKRLGASWIGSEKGLSIVSKAILEGIILPKGHGDLKDANELVKGRVPNDPTVILVNLAETIIEADKTESGEQQ